MFAVIYRWRVIPGLAAQFEAAWAAGTAAISREFGGLGSRLHKADEGIYIAYAQWPDKAAWEKAMETRMRHSDDEARRAYREAILEFETLAMGEVVSDLLDQP